MQPFLIEVRLERKEKVPPSQHEGEEFMYVLEGELDLEVQGEKVRLRPGDSCYFDSRLPHVLRAASARPPRLIVVVATAGRRRRRPRR
jgi:quercetin dioxygenase-like cupin family protein